MILRIQDNRGRGPYRPGFSHKWVDSFRIEQLPPIYEEAPEWLEFARKAQRAGKHVGCAVNGRAGILAWFSPMEVLRLMHMGFWIADASDCEIILRTKTQLLIASTKPLRMLPEASLVEALA